MRVKGSDKNKIYKLENCLKVRQSLPRWRHQEISVWHNETCNYDGQDSGFDHVYIIEYWIYHRQGLM